MPVKQALPPLPAWLCGVGLLIFPAQAGAQDIGKAAVAQGLYDEAKALMAAGRAGEACPKFEESQRIDPGSGTLINLALCYEQTGRLASAWSTYLEAAAAARATGNADRESGARERANLLAPRVAKLSIEVPPEARLPGLRVSRDGVEVGPAQWGVALPSDEGTHEVTAEAPGRREWRTTLRLSGAGKTLTVQVPALLLASPSNPSAASAAAGPGSPESARSGGSSAERPASDTSSPGAAQRALALGCGGLGVAGLAVGAFFGLRAMSKKDQAEGSCVGAVCGETEDAEAGNAAHAAGNIATAATLLGAAGVAGGLALWFTAPRHHAQWVSQVRVGAGSVQVRGTF